MVSPAMNAIVRRSSTLKVSHVLSGSTRSLSSTSSPAARACAARTAAFVTAHHPAPSVPSSSRYGSLTAFGKRPFSTPAGHETAAAEEPVQEREQQEEGQQQKGRYVGWNSEDRPYGNRLKESDRDYPPSRTIFIGNLPFFCTEADVRETFEAIAPIESLRFGIPKQTHNTPYAHITFSKLTDATAIFESAKQEPFYLEGRECRIGYAKGNQYAPARLVYFDNFNQGDLGALRNFLGPLARWVDNAWFIRERDSVDTFKPNGLIQFRTIEQATQAINERHMSPGPDGLPVYLRYARDDKAGGYTRKRVGRDYDDNNNRNNGTDRGDN